MNDPKHESEAAAKARRGRNLLLACALAAFVVLIFIITVIKISHNGGLNP